MRELYKVGHLQCSGGTNTGNDFSHSLVSPSALESINMLYTHLRSPMAQSSITVEPDPNVKRYHEALLTALGAYANRYEANDTMRVVLLSVALTLLNRANNQHRKRMKWGEKMLPKSHKECPAELKQDTDENTQTDTDADGL